MSKTSRRDSKGDKELVLPVELIHIIQSSLPLKEGGRSCILSKSWLRAWYTLPTLKLIHPNPYNSLTTHEIETNFNNLCRNTLQRYYTQNTPIQSFHLVLSIFYKFTLHDAYNWLRLVLSNTCLKHLSLDVNFYLDEDSPSSFTLPNELFSSQALHTIHLTTLLTTRISKKNHFRIGSTNVINCVSLRVLDLDSVFINQDMLNKLLSTCTLLEKVKLHWCGGVNHVKVKNLVRLTELDIHSIADDDLWDINNVPSLYSFRYCHVSAFEKPLPFQMDWLASVKQLCIEGDLRFNSFFDTLESKFPVLESLSLSIHFCKLKDLVFTSASLKWLTLTIYSNVFLAVNVQVYAPKLLSFIYNGKIPSLLFQTTPPKQVKLIFYSWENLGHSSYLFKMREALNSSSKFDIYIGSSILNSLARFNDIDVDDLKRRVSLLPVIGNVELELETSLDEHEWEKSRFFDAFFLICHPSYIRCRYHVIRKTLEWNSSSNQLKQVLLKNHVNGNWEALTTSKNYLHKYTGHLECKLIWFV